MEFGVIFINVYSVYLVIFFLYLHQSETLNCAVNGTGNNMSKLNKISWSTLVWLIHLTFKLKCVETLCQFMWNFAERILIWFFFNLEENCLALT